jgi:hypothetical protein
MYLKYNGRTWTGYIGSGQGQVIGLVNTVMNRVSPSSARISWLAEELLPSQERLCVM